VGTIAPVGLGVSPPAFVLVGKCDNVNIRQFRKSDIDPVTVVTFAGAANDAHSNVLSSCGPCGPAELRGQNSTRDGNRAILQELASGSRLHGDSLYQGWKLE
jgi:hypothetical protein